jgi:hypothetical protein
MGYKNTTKYKDFFSIGQKFGQYTIQDNNIIVESEAKVYCKCSCGAVKLVSCYTLIKGTSTKCLTCGNSLKREKNPSWKGYGSIPGKVVSKLKRDAIKRNIVFDLDINFLNELFKKQDGKCALSKLDLDNNYGTMTLSLDRIDSSKGYVENNVQWTHKDINMMKRDYDQGYFIYLCKLITSINTT